MRYGSRRSIRLPGYAYRSPGAYFVTTCVEYRQRILANVVDGKSIETPFGEIVGRCWKDLPLHYRSVELDESIVMPDHFQAILIIKTNSSIGLSEMIRAFKSFSAKQINELRGIAGAAFWQRGFYDRIIRNASALDRVRQYIRDNPKNWKP
jgi:putative transposase